MGIVDIVGIQTPRKKDLYPQEYKNSDFYDLETYLVLARRSILKFASKHASHFTVQQMLNSEDVISNIATSIMMAHWRYNGIGSQRAYLILCSIYAISRYMKRKKKSMENPNIPLGIYLDKDCFFTKNDTPEKQAILREEYSNFVDTDILTDSEKECMIMYYLDYCSGAEIGRRKHITRERVRQILNSATKKLIRAQK